MITRRLFIVSLVLLLASPMALFAASKEELQKRFKERYPQVVELKQKGAIGETDEGYLDSVEGSEGSDVVAAENSDRRELYGLIAKETSVSADDVAKHAAQKNFQKAKKGEFLKYGGKWHKKA
jgi:uncharacterized protein YdbL (DUF1318 family)